MGHTFNNTFTNSGNGEQNSAQGEGGIRYHQSSPAPPPVIPHDPPLLEPCFLHREEELAWLNERLHPGKVVAVCGPGGMGKSALAAQAVSKLEPSRFPDGIIFHSFYHQPSAEQALQAVCAAFKVEAKTNLVGGARQALSGRKALLMLDGTEEADDLQAVLRLRGQCGVLITSRKNEDAPDAPLELKPLDEQTAEEVFLRYIGSPVGDLASVQGICKLLNGWPVALRIAGFYLRNNKKNAAKYLHWMNKTPFRMLGSGRHQEDNMALLLEHSLLQVSADAVQAMRLAGVLAFAPIGLMPFAIVLVREGEYMDELKMRSSDALLELITYGLLKFTEYGWQVSHALIHAYARTELPLSREDLERLAGWYIAFCLAASKEGVQGYAHLDEEQAHCLRLTEGYFESGQGYARLDGERAHCLRLMESCLASGLWQEVKGLEGAMWEYLDRQGHWTDRLTALEMRLTAARQAGDRGDEGWCLNDLGDTCDNRGEPDKALAWYEQARPIYRELGHKEEELVTLNNIGAIYRQQGKCEQALKTYQQSLSIWQSIGNRKGEGTTLNNIGMLYDAQEDYEQALCYFEQALLITREVGDEIGEGITLSNIAAIYRAQDNHAKVLEYLEQALAIQQQIGDRAGEAQSRWNIGFTYMDMGDLAQAEEYLAHAVQIEEALGHPDLENDRRTLARLRAKRRRDNS
ncbi:hypothetical protein GCAAIG_07390 [Candidatus Electronema halotolerans]